ncbi:hypothetical protein NEOKW01_1162 [Nematocida sp. AWRm80]|nr:hypothetical protein NEOKW01_1162 [Nematocida sp. AWRm80]
MDSMQNKEVIPFNMRCLVMLASCICLPIVIGDCKLTDKTEITWSLVGHIIGPYFGMIPLPYKTSFLIGSALNLLPMFLAFNGNLRAFSLGAISAYCRVVADLFCQSLCVHTKRSAVSVVSNFVTSWISSCTFFSLHFCPILSTIAILPPTVIIFTILTSYLSYKYIIKTPEELLKKYQEEKSKSKIYEQLHHTLAYINGPGVKDNEEFRQEYKDFLNSQKKEASPIPLINRVKEVALGVNVSFIYIAFQKAMSIDGIYSLFRNFLGMMQLFTWAFKYASDTSSFVAQIIPVIALYVVCVSTNSGSDILVVFLMILGVGFLPTPKTTHKPTPFDVALKHSLQYFLALGMFLFVSANISY